MRTSRQVVKYDAFPELSAMRARAARRSGATRLVLILAAAAIVAIGIAAIYLVVWLIGLGAHAVAAQGNRETSPDFVRHKAEAPAPQLRLPFRVD